MYILVFRNVSEGILYVLFVSETELFGRVELSSVLPSKFDVLGCCCRSDCSLEERKM